VTPATELVVPDELAGERVDRVVALLTGWSRADVQVLLEAGEILVGGARVAKSRRLESAEVIEVRGEPAEDAVPGAEAVDVVVVHEDADVVVVAKPVGLVVHPGAGNEHGTLVSGLIARYPEIVDVGDRTRPGIVHRLDRETSGLMVFAKTPEAKAALQGNWEQFEKRYFAVAEGSLAKKEGTFKSWLDETNPYRVVSVPRRDDTRHAVTHYKVLKEGKGRSLVELTLETGRRHQIRVHLRDAGCPIVGDEKYGAKSNPARRLGLHSCFLKVAHPVTEKEMRFDSRLPVELARLV
jgi:23S rRNA pseudouridine1911/1915/1917 synthase